ncbi:DUF5655 domain-containing protein [Lacihabitans soyangensis]|uniref:DUF5655 domain-containing protein n=1 Tax=Lacihabitans soyangensis TaxID=869394 RepID=A0AAE3H140_9BACT|nr:DUF5655 domain-containing protein [Lacihabitans soyangensis]MCP9762973.1 hypothetical protein [Lacihabitans soyangensis]
MKLYQNKNNKLNLVSGLQFKLEKEIQNLVENNVNELFGLKFIKSELTVKNFRIDTLCYDHENKSFVIIEYKRDRNFSVIDQGYTYMSLLLNNKSDFILEFNESGKETLKRDEVDWSQSRVIFIAPGFTEFQKHSINFKDVPFELWEVNQFENNLVGFSQHKTESKESISTISSQNSSIITEITKEVTVYSEQDHLYARKKDERVIEMYTALKKRVVELGDEVEMVPKKHYISFKSSKTFCDFIIFRDHIKLLLNLKKGELDDPKGLTKDLSNQGHWGNGDYEIWINIGDDLDYTMFLVGQSYKKHRI